MAGRLFAIGDIHGCDRALEALIGAIQPRRDDRLVFLGDYVDRGPNSRRVLEQLIELGSQCTLIPLLGNHEEMMLDTLIRKVSPARWIRNGAADTLDSYGFQGDPSIVPVAHLGFLEACLKYFEAEQHFFVHANYLSHLPLEQQPVEYLQWKTLHEAIPGPHISGKTAIVGHTANKSGDIVNLRHLVCIDTYCYGGGWLTALDVLSGSFWQTDLIGTLRQGELTQ